MKKTNFTVLSIVGARPNFVKLAAVDAMFRKYFNHVIVHTGQHYDYELSRAFFEDLSIPEPDYYLGVGSGTHCYQVGEIIRRLEKVLLEVKPDLVVVYGDTNSTLGGALAAAKMGFRVAHVEAGLRCFDMSMPEEINRRVVDHISWLLFAPTSTAVRNLYRENVWGEIHLVGDVHVDVLNRWLSIAEAKSKILDELDLDPGQYIVVTVHRAENTDNLENLKNIVTALNILAKEYTIVFPIHPRTYNALKAHNLLRELTSSNIKIIKPLRYIDFIKLLKHSFKVVTDSGGVQKEAYVLGIPCIVLRKCTEWIELVEAGWVVTVGTDVQAIVNAVRDFKPYKDRDLRILGDGKASEKITDIIKGRLGA